MTLQFKYDKHSTPCNIPNKMDARRYMAQCPVITCERHQNGELDIYCHTCKTSICLDCVKMEHMNHEFDQISKLARIIRKEIPTVIRAKTQSILSKYRRDLEILTEFQESNQNNSEGIINRLNMQRNALHALTDSETDTMMATCRKRADDRKKELERCITQNKKKIQKIKELFAFLHDSSRILSNQSLLQLKSDFETKLTESTHAHRTPCNYENELFYVEGKVMKDRLKSMVGRLIQNVPSKVTISERTNFAAGDKLIFTVLPVSPDHAWINKLDTREIELFGIDGSVKNTRELDCEPCSLDIKENGDMFYTTASRRIMKVDQSGSITMVMNTKPLMPLGLSSARGGELLVTMAEKWDFKLKDNSRRIVQRIKTSGELVKTYEYDTDGSTRLFTFPRRARQNYNGDICVSDITRAETGRLCVLSIDGNMRFTYTGQNLKARFLPLDVVCDCTSNIIVNDFSNRAIHLLGPTGDFVKYLTLGLTESSRALGFCKSALWIGSERGSIQVFDYRYD